MPINQQKLMAVTVEDQPLSYTDGAALLYALGVGFGGNPLDRKELPYVYEAPSLKTVPTLATVLLPDDLLAGCGFDDRQVLHVALKLDLYRPLPAAAHLLANRRVVAVHDLGANKGARIVVQSEVRLAKDETALFSLASTLLAPGEGGFGGTPPGEASVPQVLPRRDPDLSCDIATRPDQALLFRLSGGRSSLHVESGAAHAAGFDRPMLQSRCSAGIACRAILKTICEYDYTLITAFAAQFAAPVYPGETLTTDMWQDRNIVTFRCTVKARNSVVLTHGRCTLV
jgi:acyl dehydratase